MYYYIFEPPQGPKEYERTAQIKDLLSQLGIAGEMAAPQPGRSIEDLVKVAIAKRYSTIVTVGGIDLINRVARAIVSHDVVLGIIPLSDDPDIGELIGTTDWRVAAEQLKRRRWQHIQLGSMNGMGCFLTAATVQVPAGKEFGIKTPDFELNSEGPTLISITPLRQSETPVAGLDLCIQTEQKPKTGLLSFFKGKQEVHETSHFTVTELSLTTTEAYPIMVAGENISETSVDITTETKGIRLIVGKGISN